MLENMMPKCRKPCQKGTQKGAKIQTNVKKCMQKSMPKFDAKNCHIVEHAGEVGGSLLLRFKHRQYHTDSINRQY